MKYPKPIVITDADSSNNWFHEIIDVITQQNCTEVLDGLIPLKQALQKVKIDALQEQICSSLQKHCTDMKWKAEHSLTNSWQDRFDIIGTNENRIFVIELDKWRADQVAKKILSRYSILLDQKKESGFVSLCYGGTNSMSQEECIKYFGYGKKVFEQSKMHYAGMIIEEV